VTGRGDLPAPPVTPLRWVGGWQDGSLEVLDQTLLPVEERVLVRRRANEVIEDIRRLAIRGAPLLGIAGAYAVVLAAREAIESGVGAAAFRPALKSAAARIGAARPTAVNLASGVSDVLFASEAGADPAACAGLALERARALEQRERAACESIARHGAKLLAGKGRILTHCNAGALVTPGLGTALAPIYALHHRGAKVHVWVDETRPLLQGLRLTSYELTRAGVPHTVVGDGAAPGLMRRGQVDAAIVGADRICANGDVVNKVGTYGVALACRAHGIPFYVAAPLSTFDAGTARGEDVVIEERRGDGRVYLKPGTSPDAVSTAEPAFDVTPADLVTAYLTEEGVKPGPRGK
jgi:methylthioribose-1-phosphate isomerase